MFRLIPRLALLCVLFTPVLAPLPSFAGQIGVNFVSNRDTGAALGSSEVAGLADVEQPNWNNTPANPSGAMSNLDDASGAGTTTDVAWNSQGTWTTTNGTASPNSKLINGYLDAVNAGGFVTVDFTSIPYAEYDVYVYFGSDGNGRTGGVQDMTGGAGTEYGYSTNSNKGGGGFGQGDYVRTTAPGGSSPAANFCVFVGNTTSSFNIRINRGSNNSGIHGVQIVETTPTPGLPEVENAAASGVAATSATANGNLVDNGDGADSAELTIYWGQSDGVATAGSWAGAAPAGARTSPGAFSAALSPLLPNTTYFYRAFAANSAGFDWAPSSEIFTTPAEAPTVANIAASEVFATSAKVGGDVTATGGEAPTLTIYYGDNDAGTDAGGWDASAALGVQTDPATTVLSGLNPATSYFFRASASNSGGTAWAPSTASFTTPSVALPAVSNSPASGVNGTFATLNGSVDDPGGDPPTVTIYYGTADGGTDANAWEGAVGLGVRSGSFSALVSNLLPETTYHFRAFASNAGGAVWASPSLTFATPVFTPPSVVINEIHYDENDKTQRAEFIELHNPSGDPVDLSGYYFSSGIDYTFPGGATLPAGGYVVVAEDPATMQSKFGVAGAFGPFAGGTSLRNSGETVTLRDPGDTKVDEVDYALGFPWPTVGDLVGVPAASPSIELVNPLLDNDLGGSWRASGFPVASAGPGGGGPVDFVQSGDVWEYLDDGSNQGATGWKTDAANTAGWASASQLGYNEGDEATLVGDGDGDPVAAPRAITTYFRRAVSVTGLAGFSNMRFGLLRDDGAVVYVNGVEAFRDNMPTGAITWTTPASGAQGGANESTFFQHNVSPGLFVEGVNVIAVEIHQSSTGSSDISFDLELTGEVGASAGNNAPTPGGVNRSFSTNAPPQLRQVEHAPVGRVPGRDKSILPGEEVLLTAKATDPGGVGSVLLEYQIVEPGDYMKDDDPRYATEWTAVPMLDDGTGGDAVAADATYSVTLPAALQLHRRLVRYRVVATDGSGLSVRAPYQDDAGRNFAYFVYGGAPTWQAGGTTYDFAQLEPVPIYHLVTTREEHEQAQSIPNATGGSYSGSDYLWTGALVYNGEVYDHIRFRARGGVWRYSMGKNMWKFDFNRGRRFQARDDYGEKYDTDWDKLNFSALIQQGNFGQRGEQGLFEGAGFKLHNLAGNPAPRTHYVHFRIVEQRSETGLGGSQFDDDFQGLYMAVEQMDGQFLDEHKLPDGNLYKMEGGTGELNNQGPTQPSNKADLNAFFAYKSGAQTQAWWEDNLVLDDYYSFRAIATAIHDYDIHAGKNYFFFHRPVDPLDPNSDKWQVLNWDLDLTWTTTYGGGGTTGPLSASVLAVPQLALGYRNRTREIMDLLFNSEQTGLLLDEIAQFVHTPGQTSFVDADKDMWDTNPILVSGYINGSKAGHNKYWEAVSPRNFANMKQRVKNYISTQRNFMQSSILNADESQVPNTPTITYAGASGFPVNGLSFTSSPYSSPSGSAFAAMEWRLAEITPPAMLNKLEPPKYEIEADWESGELASFVATMDYPTLAARPGRTYRARVRHQDAAGRWGHWSAPLEFVSSVPDISLYIDGLRVTELHYHPADATPAEQGMGWTTSSFEFVEIQNIGAVGLDLTDVRFTKGVDFDFPADTIIAPGAYLLVVSNQAAFESRHGAGLPVAGEWAADNKLDNAGENLKLSFGAGIALIEFTYDDRSPWPEEADGDGYSLVLDRPAASLPADHADPLAWRASRLLGGSPGAADGVQFAVWAGDNGLGAGAALGDDLDGDLLINLLEYALASDPGAYSAADLPAAALQLLTIDGATDWYLTLSFRRQVGADDLTYIVEFSADMENWSPAGGERFATLPHGDGTATEVWRSPVPTADLVRYYIRLRVEG